MTVISKRAKARPIFRRLAFGMAVVSLVLGAVIGFAPVQDRRFISGICLFVGFVMLTIARTGLWPPSRE